MMNTEQYREHIERTFNAFCKIVIYHAALNAYKKIRRKQQFEVSLDYLREFDFDPVAAIDSQESGHCEKRTVSSRTFVSAGKVAGSAVFAVLCRLQRYGNRTGVRSLQEYNLSQTEDCLALTVKRNGCVRK